MDRLAGLVALFLVLSGCLAPAVDSGPRFGMGLEMSEPWPSPGEFREGSQQVGFLKGFLAAEMGELLASCGRLSQWESFNRTLEQDRFWDIFPDFFGACTPYQQVEDLAREARRLGEEAEVFHGLQAEARLAWESFEAALALHPGPGTKAEAQLWWELAVQVVGLR
jgi:hypothetical protein